MPSPLIYLVWPMQYSFILAYQKLNHLLYMGQVCFLLLLQFDLVRSGLKKRSLRSLIAKFSRESQYQTFPYLEVL